jgi:hypothetical protein
MQAYLDRQRAGAHGQPKRKGKIAQGKEAMQHTLTRLQLSVKQGHAGMVSRLQQSRREVKSIGVKMVKGVTRRFGRKAPLVREGDAMAGVDGLGVPLGVPSAPSLGSSGRPQPESLSGVGVGAGAGAGSRAVEGGDREVELTARLPRATAGSDGEGSGGEWDSAASHGAATPGLLCFLCTQLTWPRPHSTHPRRHQPTPWLLGIAGSRTDSWDQGSQSTASDGDVEVGVRPPEVSKSSACPGAGGVCLRERQSPMSCRCRHHWK